VRAFVDALHAEGRRFVPILDPGIALAPGYAPYDDGVAAGVFLRDLTGAPYIGEVWPGAVHFIDFMHPAVDAYWEKHVGAFYEAIPFDGLWVVRVVGRRR
jgi:alpha-glucosidase (family GH31 glycosyl hydrolase)